MLTALMKRHGDDWKSDSPELVEEGGQLYWHATFSILDADRCLGQSEAGQKPSVVSTAVDWICTHVKLLRTHIGGVPEQPEG